jgi:hypothetical protein
MELNCQSVFVCVCVCARAFRVNRRQVSGLRPTFWRRHYQMATPPVGKHAKRRLYLMIRGNTRSSCLRCVFNCVCAASMLRLCCAFSTQHTRRTVFSCVYAACACLRRPCVEGMNSVHLLLQQIYANEPLQHRSILRAAFRTGSCDLVVHIDIAGLTAEYTDI